MASLPPELRAALARLTADLGELTRILENSDSHGPPVAPFPVHSSHFPRRSQTVPHERRFSFAQPVPADRAQSESEHSDIDFPFAEEREKILKKTLPDADRMKGLRDAFLLGILDERSEADRDQDGPELRPTPVGYRKRPGKQIADETKSRPRLSDWFNNATIQVDRGSSRSPRKLVTVLTSEPYIGVDSLGPGGPVNTTLALGRAETAVRREIVERIRAIWPKTLGSEPILDSSEGSARSGTGAEGKGRQKHSKDDDEAEEESVAYADDENAFWELDALPEMVFGMHYRVKIPKQGEKPEAPATIARYTPPRIDLLPSQGRLW